MKSKDNNKSEITLQSINKKLDKIKKEIKKIQKQNKDPKGFIASLFLMMGFLLISFAFSITIQNIRFSVEYLLFFLVIYIVSGFAFLWMSLKLIEKKYGKL